MKTLKTLLITLFMVNSAIFLSACNVVKVHEHDHGHEHEHNGPPPHAPAHGYRHKHGGHTLEYNYDLGVYIVIGMTDYYYSNGTYYKLTKHGWFSSHDIDKGWNEYKKDVLPGKLHHKYGHEKGHGKGKEGKGNRSKNKHDDD